MAQPSDSFNKFNYWLRPSKQVERKIMIEILLKIMGLGYPISDYRYLGFGSVYYADFVMFHKYLYINHMTCVEWSDIPKRMKFNKPYNFIKLRMQSLEDALPHVLKGRGKHIVWLDYDRQLDAEMLRDIDNCILKLSSESIFLVTIDGRARVPSSIIEQRGLSPALQNKWLLDTFNDGFKELLGRKVKQDDIEPLNVPRLYYDTVAARIRESLSTLDGLEYIQLFNYIYADGAPMLTFGGMIGTAQDREKLSSVFDHDFVEEGPEAIRIAVPPLTYREKQWLDCHLKSKTSCFELDDDSLDNYRQFYKQYPTFVESIA